MYFWDYTIIGFKNAATADIQLLRGIVEYGQQFIYLWGKVVFQFGSCLPLHIIFTMMIVSSLTTIYLQQQQLTVDRGRVNIVLVSSWNYHILSGWILNFGIPNLWTKFLVPDGWWMERTKFNDSFNLYLYFDLTFTFTFLQAGTDTKLLLLCFLVGGKKT